MFNAGKNPFIFIREFVRLREPLLRDLVHACHQACRDADVLVIPTTAVLLGLTAAEKLGLPVVLATLQPTLPTRFLANCLLPPSPSWLPVASLYNLLSHYVVAECFWQLQREAVNRARQEVLGLPSLPFWGLSPRFFRETPSLHGYSPTVVPKPADWNGKHRLTGYWFLETGKTWQPPAELVRFLEAGPAPVCVGFGSMPNPKLRETTDLVVRAGPSRSARHPAERVGRLGRGARQRRYFHNRVGPARLALALHRSSRAPRRGRDHGGSLALGFRRWLSPSWRTSPSGDAESSSSVSVPGPFPAMTLP